MFHHTFINNHSRVMHLCVRGLVSGPHGGVGTAWWGWEALDQKHAPGLQVARTFAPRQPCQTPFGLAIFLLRAYSIWWRAFGMSCAGFIHRRGCARGCGM